METAKVISQVGTKGRGLGSVTLGDMSKGKSISNATSVSWDGVSHIVGENVGNYTDPITLLDFQALSGGSYQKALTYAVMGKLLGKGEYEKPIVVKFGLPVELQQDEKKSEEIKAAVKSWLIGDHAFAVNGNKTLMTIKSVTFLTQPAGTFFYWGMDDNGVWQKSESYITGGASVGICDVGGNTVDIIVINGGNVSWRFTTGESIGMRRAIDLVGTRIESEYGFRPSEHEIDGYLRMNKPFIMVDGDKRVDLTGIVQSAKETTSGEILSLLNKKWQKEYHRFKVLFTGGGSISLRDYFIRAYPKASVMSDNMANAIGFARYTRCYDKESAVVGLDPGFSLYKAALLHG